MATSKYTVLSEEKDGTDLAYPTELDLSSGASNILLGVAARIDVFETQATVNGTLSLTATNSSFQYFTGTTAGQILKMPDATTLQNGMVYEFYNQSTQTIAVQDSTGAALFTLSSLSIAYVRLQTNSTVAGGWISWQVLTSTVASGILNYQVVSSTTFTTTSTTAVLITGFTVTPIAGTYAIWFNGNLKSSSSGSTVTCTIYKAGVAVADSVRDTHVAAANADVTGVSMTVVSFSGTDTCDVRVNTSSATLTVGSRTLLLIRMGP